MSRDLKKAIQALASRRTEGSRTVECISLEATEKLAREFDMSTRDVGIYALDNGFVPLRYLKNMGTIGLEGQARLLRSKAVVAGTGGIGGFAAELLVRMGTGTVALVDPDSFDETNLNRQRFATEKTIGMPKVEVAGAALGQINRDVDVVTHRVSGSGENLRDIVSGADVVIDGLDSLDDRLLLQQACRDEGVVMVHGAIAGTFCQVTTIYPGDAGLACLAPQGRTQGKARGVETETGNPASTPAIAAAIQVQEAVKAVTGAGSTLRGRMLYLDTEDWSVDFFELVGTDR